ncbi:hypothetical protein BSKO_03530 [Bryopsis sp. KO-2023]|nr:hypothetical protein BSKO_03530 [Bryopsis sp. KO-2023]
MQPGVPFWRGMQSMAVETSSRLFLAVLVGFLSNAAAAKHHGSCTAPLHATYNYSSVMHPGRSSGLTFEDLPGFTRSVYYPDHALVTPESRVWTTLHGWTKGETAHIISRASGAGFSMYLAKLQSGGSAPMPPDGIERFVFVLEGSLILERQEEKPIELFESSYAYIPPSFHHRLRSEDGGGFLVYEQKYKPLAATENMNGADVDGKTDEVPPFLYGITDEQPVLDTPGEMFALRKLLPQTPVYDFNIHVMDFKPGEHLFVKEVHYNQHGLMLLQGKGIYRLADKWYPVQAGDSIWMAPYVVQWYAALGSENSRYIINKDTRPPEF